MELYSLFIFLLVVYKALADCTVPSYPPDRRVVMSTIAIKAIITEKSESSAELWILDVYKGGDKLASYAGLPKNHKFDSSVRDVRLNVGVMSPCTGLQDTQIKQEYIILLQAKGHRLYLEPNPGGIIPFSSNLDSRIFKLLGWNEWSEWSPCSTMCEGGEQRRERRCVTGHCSSHTSELRSCNLFTCKGLLNLLSVDNPNYFKPTRNVFRKIPGRLSGWRLKSASYLLYPFKEAYGTDFPREFTLFLNFKPYSKSEGVLLSLTNPRDKSEFISLELTTMSGLKKLEMKLVHSTKNGTRVVAIPVDARYNKWNYLALSIGEKTTIKTYLNCKWVSTQMLDGYPMVAHPNPDIAVGYLFQGEIEQVSVSLSLEDVSEQCTVSRPITTKSSQEEDDYADEEFIDISKRRIETTKEKIVHPEVEGSGKGVPVELQPDLSQDEEPEEGSGGTGQFLVEWSSWSACGATCGRSTQTRSSRCLDSEHMMECIDAGFEKRVTRSCSAPNCQSSEFEPSHITQQDIALFRNQFNNNNNINQFNNNNVSQMTNTSFSEELTDTNNCGCKRNSRCNTHKSGCICLEGWTGLNCSVPTCTPQCKQGTCVQPNVCACKSGYTGARCQEAFCDHDCLNGGRCVAPFVCGCSALYSGEYCQHSVCKRECKHGGSCVGENLCSCPHGFSGSDCGDFTCTSRCLNGGACTAPDMCSCRPGYTGPTCSTKVCSKYVHTKVPVRRAYKRVVSLRGGEMNGSSEPVSRTFYRTYYKTVLKCAD